MCKSQTGETDRRKRKRQCDHAEIGIVEPQAKETLKAAEAKQRSKDGIPSRAFFFFLPAHSQAFKESTILPTP